MAQKLSDIVGASSGGAGTFTDNRTWKNWQDFYGDVESFTSDVAQTQRDPGNTTGGTGTGAQNRKVAYGVIVNWTVPTGVTKIRVSTIGGGGAGGCRRGGSYYGGDGGGGAGFASGEFNVTGGEVLDIIVGRGGQGNFPSQQAGNSGTTSSVAAASGSGGAAFLSVSSTGGGGGTWGGNGSNSAGVGSVSGTALSGNSITNNGGQGGQGSSQAFGFGPEGYCSAGGGAAGHFLGAGGVGGHGPWGGYTWAQGGGGGINGMNGGRGSGATEASGTSQYRGWSGAGGGSRTNGDAGVHSQSTALIQGGQGYSDIKVINDYSEDVVQDNSQGQAEYYRGESTLESTDWNSSDGWYKKGKGVRYGDGITDAPAYASGGGGGTPGTYVAALKEGSGSSGSSGATAWITMTGDAFNGILGRCTGGGAAGVSNDNHAWGNTYANGMDGGSGAGGSGSACSTTNWRSNNTSMTAVFEFDTTNLAWGMKRSLLANSSSFIGTGHGGAGGACGGGGGGAPYACAGPGGLGAGGGGGGGHYNSSYGGNPGPGGPGYVLIEW